MPRVRIVLVEPRESGNVGAAARAMMNFGLTDLTIIGDPRPLDDASIWWASGAEQIVRNARRVQSLHEALEGVHLAIATSSGRGREMGPNRTPRDVAALRRSLGAESEMAIVFGREQSGLTTAELDLCSERASVPTSPQFPVMNLAQAVSLFCYELWLDEIGSPEEMSGESDLASHDEIERIHVGARELLLDAGFLNPENPDAIYGELRRYVGRSRLTRREAVLFLGVLRQLRWAIDRSQRGASNDSD
ncbi:MAG: RNA methyltransferase [Thermoanaerobaculia bacterium]|nr:RNA methyltransferase [Thermoanaerobaculia bacterium]